jgi:iron complex outermembrane receptor protein
LFKSNCTQGRVASAAIDEKRDCTMIELSSLRRFAPPGGHRLIRVANAAARWILLGLAAFAYTRPVHAAEVAGTNPDFASLSIEELMRIPVTSFSKHEERFSEVPGALYVITQDDIRRSGALSIPEALRMAPGVQVARVDAHTWAVSARGFNDVFANKLLVLQDGRSIYTPLFSGVFWDVQDTIMEDIDRIEVIRGPGGTLWGANAVNGVINIITRKAADTQGVLISAGGGSEELGFGGVRYGDKINDQTHFRIYAKYFNRDASVLPTGEDADDRWQMGRGGFRLDWDASDRNLLTVQGDVYAGWLDQTFTTLAPVFPYPTNTVADTVDVNGGNLLGRWTHTISDDSSWSLQAYYDRTYRDAVIFHEGRDTLDVDFQHRFRFGARNHIIWGLGYRYTHDRTADKFDVSMHPRERGSQLFGGFVQDEMAVIPERLTLTLGTKLEHNDFSGFEIQPSGRLMWTPSPEHTIWAAVSRAVRSPARTDHDIQLNQKPTVPGPFVSSILGNDNFDSETLIAYELGYRVQVHKRLSLDLALFYNQYDDVRGLRIGGLTNNPPPATIALLLDNMLKGESYGGEIAGNFQLTDWWRWRASYSYLDLQLHAKAASVDPNTEHFIEGTSPHHQFSIASGIDFPAHLGLDWTVRYVDTLPAVNVPSYVTLDVRLSWRPRPNLELAVAGLNLLDNQHPEFRPTSIRTQATEVQRSVYGKVTWRF